jgi:radical SAM superfamily enzyme YgiQ (UPF0313 family)
MFNVSAESDVHIVLGGPGFSDYGSHWLEYPDLDHAIRGEAESSFLLHLKRLEEDGDIRAVPGCMYREALAPHEVPRDLVDDLDATAFPAYELVNLVKYPERDISPAILTKRGCAFRRS